MVVERSNIEEERNLGQDDRLFSSMRRNHDQEETRGLDP